MQLLNSRVNFTEFHIFLKIFFFFFYAFPFSRPRWVVPVLPKGELEVLLEAAIDLSKKGRNTLDIISLVCSVEN